MMDFISLAFPNSPELILPFFVRRRREHGKSALHARKYFMGWKIKRRMRSADPTPLQPLY